MEQHGSRFEQFTDFEVNMLYFSLRRESHSRIRSQNKYRDDEFDNLLCELKKENEDRELIFSTKGC